nr:unnamed protein product [Naegleria fowleri]
MFGFTSESTSRSDNLNYYTPPPRHPAFKSSQRYETTPHTFSSEEASSPTTYVPKTSSQQQADSSSVANSVLPIQLLILNSSFTPILVSGGGSSSYFAETSSSSFLNSFGNNNANTSTITNHMTTSTTIATSLSQQPPESSTTTTSQEQQQQHSIITTPIISFNSSSNDVMTKSSSVATTHKDRSAASSMSSTSSNSTGTTGAATTSLSILFQQHQQQKAMNSSSSNNNNCLNSVINTEPISSLLLSSLSGASGSGASATGALTPRSGSQWTGSGTTRRPQSARYTSSSTGATSGGSGSSGSDQHKLSLSTSNHSLGGVSSGTGVGSAAATSFISSKSDGAASTTGLYSKNSSSNMHELEGSNHSNWATSKQYRDGMEHIHKLREKFMEHVGALHWWNGGGSTNNNGTNHTNNNNNNNPSNSNKSSNNNSSHSPTPNNLPSFKDSSEIKKQRSMMECASKLIFLDEFYDALNMRVRTFETIKDVIQSVEILCKRLLNFAEKKQGYVRSSCSSMQRGHDHNTDNSNNHDGQASSSSSSGGHHTRPQLSTDEMGITYQPVLSSPSTSSQFGKEISEEMEKDMSSSPIGHHHHHHHYHHSKTHRNHPQPWLDVPHLKEFVSAMEQNRLYPCFQHERLRDLLITLWLEISKCESGGEEKMNAFFNLPMKRAIVDSDRVNNTLENSNRNSMNASTLLALNEKTGVETLFNSSIMRKESSKSWSLDKIFHIEENTADRLANDIKILTDMFLIELEDVLAVFQEKHSKFVKNWMTEAYEKCLLPFHAIQAIKKRKDTLKTLRNEFVFEEDDFEAKYVIDKDWRFVWKLCEHTSDWRLNSKNLPLVLSFSSVENYSSMPDMRLTKFIGYVDYSLENVMRAYCHDKTLDCIYSSKVSWHEYCKPCASSSIEKYPTAIMTTVNESSGLFKKQTMEMVVSGKTKFIGGENMTELFQGAFFFKSCNHLKNTKEGKSDSDSKLISIGARFFTKIDNCRTRIIEVKSSRIVGFLKKTFLFPINMKKEMGLFYSSMVEILEREQEQGFPIASSDDYLMRIICDYAKLYCRVDFKLKYTSMDDDIVL